MTRLTIYQRLKPEVKGALLSNMAEYESTITSIIEKLSNETFYSNLTISDISSLYTFTQTVRRVHALIWNYSEGLIVIIVIIS